jgi:hypothetical protein
MLEAYIAMKNHRMEDARRLFLEHCGSKVLNFGMAGMASLVGIAVGETKRAIDLMQRPVVVESGPMLVRLDPMLHPLLDHPPFAPRRSTTMDLVWPLEAPMIDRERLKLFRQVRIESGLPEGSDILPTP